MPNPNIAEAGKSSRFSEGNSAAKNRASKPSFNHCVLEIAGFMTDDDFLGNTKDLKAAVKRYRPKQPLTVMMHAAIAFYEKVLDGNMNAIKQLQKISDGIDGLGNKPTVAELIGQARSELREERKVQNPSLEIPPKEDKMESGAAVQAAPNIESHEKRITPVELEVKDQAQIERDLLYHNAIAK